MSLKKAAVKATPIVLIFLGFLTHFGPAFSEPKTLKMATTTFQRCQREHEPVLHRHDGPDCLPEPGPVCRRGAHQQRRPRLAGLHLQRSHPRAGRAGADWDRAARAAQKASLTVALSKEPNTRWRL